mmetsp:Transcript_59102/g.183504  ORF Transcript_59102/g.183504 Transcript_59102/m.183504 type:complete len:394 (+) Transcript_59102:53-1234(+)
MRLSLLLVMVVAMLVDIVGAAAAAELGRHRRHGHHHRHRHKLHHGHAHRHGRQRHRAVRRVAAGNATEAKAEASGVTNRTANSTAPAAKTRGMEAAEQEEKRILGKMKALEKQLDAKASGAPRMAVVTERSLEVNGPLPPDFTKRFSEAVAEATSSDAARVKVIKTRPRKGGTYHLVFQAPLQVAEEVQEQAADPDSRLAAGKLHEFLVVKEDAHAQEAFSDSKDGEEAHAAPKEKEQEEEEEEKSGTAPQSPPQADGEQDREEARDAARRPVSKSDLPMGRGVDVDTQMPYGELEPFGREDTAQELTEQSISQSNQMVDQLERAEVAEEKRAVFRALTRLRGAALTAFDGIARSQTGTIDEYNKLHQWRAMHPLRHLANEEADVSKWAFPDF